MIPEEVIQSLAVRNETKILLLVLDGIGGLPVDGRTELQAADTPNLDRLATGSVCGQTVPVARGITPGIGPASLALFGYDPFKYSVSRGVLEAMGVGMEVNPQDVAARGNFASRNERGIITDRRAGHIATERCAELCELLSNEIPEIEGTRITLKAGTEHRFHILFSREDLDGRVTDADPQTPNHLAMQAHAIAESAKATADLANEFIRRAGEVLRGRDDGANTVLLRGFGKRPQLTTMPERYRLYPAAVVRYPLYKGLAKLMGMSVLDAGSSITDEMTCLRAHFGQHDFFYLHYSQTDAPLEDPSFERKVAAIEELDRCIPAILAIEPDVIAVTGDRCNPTLLRHHSWHPNPFLLWSPFITPDGTMHFGEIGCSQGGLGLFPAVEIMPLLLAHGLKLRQYGS